MDDKVIASQDAVAKLLGYFYDEFLVDKGLTPEAGRAVDSMVFAGWLTTKVGSQYYPQSLPDDVPADGWAVLETSIERGHIHSLVCNFRKYLIFRHMPPSRRGMKRVTVLIAVESDDGHIGLQSRTLGLANGRSLYQEGEMSQLVVTAAAQALENLEKVTISQLLNERASAVKDITIEAVCSRCGTNNSINVVENVGPLAQAFQQKQPPTPEPRPQRPAIILPDGPRGGFQG